MEQFVILTNPLCISSEEVLLTEERKWNDIPACKHFRGHTVEAEVSKLVMRLVRHYECKRTGLTKICMLHLCNVLNVIRVGLDRYRTGYTREQDCRTVKVACAN